ncbi:MAG TPA: M36 family metallopeptidase [Solirubrobacteraceae bacterium]|nr:M36 family metallopeptidase [Solirubrobacteraceae bacterium]
MTRLRIAALTALLTLAATAPAGAVIAPVDRPLRNIDVRKADGGPVTPREQRARGELERDLGDEGTVSTDRINGGARMVARTDGFLTGRRSGSPADVALDYVAGRPAVFGLDDTDIDRLRLTRRSRSADGVTHLAYVQTYEGIAGYDNVLLANVDEDGRLVNVGGAAVDGLRVDSVDPDLDAEAALVIAKLEVGGALIPPRGRQGRGPEVPTSFTNGDSARLTLFNDGATTRLAWRLQVTGDSEVLYEVVLDASSGRVLKRRSLTEFAAADVFEFYPGAPNGGVAHTVDLVPPWLTSTDKLCGNNAHAYADVDATNNPATAPPLDCPPLGDQEIPPSSTPPPDWTYPFTVVPAGPSCPPSGCTWNSGDPGTRPANRDRATTQLFYSVNRFHDHLAAPPINFANGAGEFETAGAGPGQDHDPVMAETDNFANPPAPSVNNASMSTPLDGQPPRMQMYLFTNPSLNSADAADVVFHEYTHGLTTRSIGSGVGLDTFQSRSMGEGWSDWYALDFIEDQGLLADTATPNEINIGAYLSAGGLRFQGADCPVGGGCPGTAGAGGGGFTLGDLGKISTPADEVHDNGEIWLETLWDVRELLGSTGAEEVVTEGLRLSPNNPSLLEARDAIIQADRVANAGVNYDELWRVFAARGMGYSARTSSSSALSATESFDLPPVLEHEDTDVTDPVPDGDGDGIAEPGETVNLTETLTNRNPFVVQNVSGTLAATPPVTVVPANSTATWPDFAASETQTGTPPFRVSIPSSVRCGSTLGLSLVLTATSSALGDRPLTVPLKLPTGVRSSTAGPQNIPAIPAAPSNAVITFPPNSGTIDRLKVRMTRLTHSWVGDLTITLESPSGTIATLMDSPGAGADGAQGDNLVDLVFDDRATRAIENIPDQPADPAGYTGSFRPNESLSRFDGEPRAGNWILSISDRFPSADAGTLHDWGIVPDGRACSAPLNGDPAAAADAYAVETGSTLNGSSVLGNDSDPDGGSLTASKRSDPAHGALSLASNGSFAYTPEAGFVGNDSFTYSADDGNTTSDPATVAISVLAPVVDPPPPPPVAPPPPPVSPPAPPPPPAATTRVPARLEVQRAIVSGGRLDVRAAIAPKATGKVRIRFRAAGATTAFDATISDGRVNARRTLPRSQRSQRTGSVTLTYAGSPLVAPDALTLRAGTARARLVRTSSRISSGRLRVAGTVTSRAGGVVRVRLTYLAGGTLRSLNFSARITRGRWSLNTALSAAAAAAGGQLTIRYAGDSRRRIGGEQLAADIGPG